MSSTDYAVYDKWTDGMEVLKDVLGKQKSEISIHVDRNSGGILAAPHKEWKGKRAVFQPIFNHANIDKLSDTIHNHVDLLIEKLNQYANSGEVFDIQVYNDTSMVNFNFL